MDENLTIQYMRLSDVELAFEPTNPRRHDVTGIAASIRERGFNAPPLINEKTGRLVYGHGRTKGVRRLYEKDAKKVPRRIEVAEDGEWMMPVFRGVSFRSKNEAEEYLVADNRLTELGGWEPEATLSILERIRKRGKLVGTGWTENQVDAMLERIRRRKPDGPSLVDRFVVPPFTVLDAKQGYWQDRKKQWMGLGLRSELGRSDMQSTTMQSTKSYIANRGQNNGGSLFDPVLVELACRWFSPPGGTILDPFAGGSVRGVVSAFLGRRYTGVELRGDQVAANEAQWGSITGERVDQPDFMPDLTPVEKHGDFMCKRDDLYSVAGVRGGKVRSCWRLAQPGGKGPKGLVTAGSRQSPQANIVAHIAKRLGVPCRVHTPEGKLSPELESAQEQGAEVVQHKAGCNNVIIARAREDAKARGWVEIPFGMECEEAVTQTRAQVANVPKGTDRIVIAVGSGMSLAGVLHGLRDQGLEIPVLGVLVGADPEKRLDKYAPEGWRDMVELVPSGMDYHKAAAENWLGSVELDPIYEAKVLPFLRVGDLFWMVGIRKVMDTAEPPVQTGERTKPVWIEGDSQRVLPTLPGNFDMVLGCPPYYDLEVYSDDERDISNMDWDAFLDAYRAIIAAAVAQLAPNRFAFWVVGEIRGKDGMYRGFVPETIKAFEAAGARLYNEAVLLTALGSLPIRAARFFVQSRKLSRGHQNVLVFCKGDPKVAVEALGSVEIETEEEG